VVASGGRKCQGLPDSDSGGKRLAGLGGMGASEQGLGCRLAIESGSSCCRSTGRVSLSGEPPGALERQGCQPIG
jgi:hypothetical protein